MSQWSESEHPRGTAGRFGAKDQAPQSSAFPTASTGDTGPMDTWSTQVGERFVRDGKTFEVVRISPAGSAGTSRADGPTVHAKIVRDDGTLSDYTADIWSGSMSNPASAFTKAE